MHVFRRRPHQHYSSLSYVALAYSFLLRRCTIYLFTIYIPILGFQLDTALHQEAVPESICSVCGTYHI